MVVQQKHADCLREYASQPTVGTKRYYKVLRKDSYSK